MPNSNLIDYIKTTIAHNPELADREVFDMAILNIYKLDSSVFEYIQDSPRDTVLYWVHNLDKYLLKNKKNAV